MGHRGAKTWSRLTIRKELFQNLILKNYRIWRQEMQKCHLTPNNSTTKTLKYLSLSPLRQKLNLQNKEGGFRRLSLERMASTDCIKMASKWSKSLPKQQLKKIIRESSKRSRSVLAYLRFQKFQTRLQRHCLNVKRNKMDPINFNNTHKSGKKCVIKK